MIINQDSLIKNVPKFKNSPSILLVIAPYYETITYQLVEGAKEVLNKANAKIELIDVPGALEIPTAIKLASNHFSGFIALGCVIRGETSHYETVTTESARALSCLGLEGVCVGNSILTVENYEQAWERASIRKKNKGGDVANACLRMMEVKKYFHSLSL